MNQILVPICLFLTTLGFSQGVSFQRVNEFYLHGDSQVIGNNILSSDPKIPYNRPRGINDQTEMVYVDIDNDPDTFSSSSANLSIPVKSKIKYAGLYWAATYPGAVGKQKSRGGRIFYDLKKKRDRVFDLVQLKIPGSKEYTQIQGELVYDGMIDANIDLKNAAPYVCYSDVTKLLAESSTVSGSYTLANVTALEGEMYGGSSAGWMLYVIYEDEKAPLQYLTSYSGFRYIGTEKTEELEFKNFRALSNGTVKTSLTLAGLEGDLALSKDIASIYSAKQQQYIPLKSKVRLASNFFNSSITRGDNKYLDRVPNSENTLGFDLAHIKIPNPNNDVIRNDATSVKLQFKTEEDRLFVFFSAFQTEISTSFYQNVIIEGKLDTINEEQEKIESNASEEIKIENTILKERSDDLIDMINAESIAIPELESGYYVINHVFARSVNADKWAQKMREQGYSPRQFIRSSNNYHYVYLDFDTDPDVLYKRLTTFRTNKDLKKAWMLKINLD